MESPKVKMAGREGGDLARTTGEVRRIRAKSKSIEEEEEGMCEDQFKRINYIY